MLLETNLYSIMISKATTNVFIVNFLMYLLIYVHRLNFIRRLNLNSNFAVINTCLLGREMKSVRVKKKI